MTLLLIIVGYILNVILNRWISINIQKISSLDMLGMLTFWVFVPFLGTIMLLFIFLIEKGDDLTDNKFFKWFKYTPILLLFVFGSCSETTQEKSYEHRWCIKVKYYDNTLDTLTGQNWYTPQLCSNGEVYCAGTIANQVKTMTLLKDTLIEL